MSRFGHGGLLSPPGSYSPHPSNVPFSGSGGLHVPEDGSIFLGGCTGAVNPVTSFVRPRGGRGGTLNKPPKKMNHIKKPLNAFMLYMKEMRPTIVAECTLKESAAINQILGRRVRMTQCKEITLFIF